jgi:hypothetical protein
MCGEPILGQDLLVGAEARRAIVNLAPQQERVLGQMKDPIVILRKDDELVSGLLQELTAPALPAHRLRARVLLDTLPPVRSGQGEPQPGKHHMHPHSSSALPGRMPQIPWLLACLNTAVFNEAAVIIVIKHRQWLLDGRMGQEHGFTPWTIVSTVPLADDDGVDGMGLEVAAVVVAPVLRRAIRLVPRQPGHAHDCRLQPLGPGGVALPVTDRGHPAPDRHALPRGCLGWGVASYGHIRLGRYHKDDALLVEPPQIGPIQAAPIKDDLVQRTSPAKLAGAWLINARKKSVACAWILATCAARGILVQASISTISFPPSMVSSTSCTLPRLAVSLRLRVTWPQPSSCTVVSRSVASTMPVTVAPKRLACARARLVRLHKTARSRTCSLTRFCANVAGPMGPAVRAPCRVAAPHWQTPCRTGWALQPTRRMSASSLHNNAGRAFILSIPNSVFRA